TFPAGPTERVVFRGLRVERFVQPGRALGKLLALMTLALAVSAHAQTAPAPPTARPADPVKEHEPVHLKDRDGTLVPVLGYTLEDFDEFIELKNQLSRGQMRPKYTTQRLAATGTVTG